VALVSVEQAIDDLRRGKFVIIVDDEDRENEGDLCLAAELVTPEAINFMAREASGLICAPMAASWADRLGLPPMVDAQENTSRFGTAFTVSVEAREGVTTGISAYDRATTIRKLADPEAVRADFTVPGHVFPLRAREGGVQERAGQTEAAVDLARLAGLHPVAVICEIMAEDGSMARMPELERFALEKGIGIITVADLIAFKRHHVNPDVVLEDMDRADLPLSLTSRRRFSTLAQGPVVRRVAETVLPTDHGLFQLVAYQSDLGEDLDLALVMGDPSGDEPVLARIHSECLTGDVLGSRRCDCGQQLDRAMELIGDAGRGVLVYARQEGRGIGLLNKLRAYGLQDEGLDTVEANLHLGFAADSRDYRVVASILQDLGVSRLRLLTNNPRKVDGLVGCGIEVTERVPLLIEPGDGNRRYLEIKRRKLGHLLELGTVPDAIRSKIG
jgi:3,4-dihydroxy 2-butanone 4-phosphate synthase/GTP cyclohydrolase II